MPDLQRLGEDVVVHKACIHGEKSHEQNDISSTIVSTLMPNSGDDNIRHLQEKLSHNFSKVSFGQPPLE